MILAYGIQVIGDAKQIVGVESVFQHLGSPPPPGFEGWPPPQSTGGEPNSSAISLE